MSTAFLFRPKRFEISDRVSPSAFASPARRIVPAVGSPSECPNTNRAESKQYRHSSSAASRCVIAPSKPGRPVESWRRVRVVGRIHRHQHAGRSATASLAGCRGSIRTRTHRRARQGRPGTRQDARQTPGSTTRHAPARAAPGSRASVPDRGRRSAWCVARDDQALAPGSQNPLTGRLAFALIHSHFMTLADDHAGVRIQLFSVQPYADCYPASLNSAAPSDDVVKRAEVEKASSYRELSIYDEVLPPS